MPILFSLFTQLGSHTEKVNTKQTHRNGGRCGGKNNRRIYIANFAIFKIATSWSYHLHLREKSWSFSLTKLRDFLVGSAHVRSGYSACIHACSACSMHEGRGYRYTFQRARVASSPEVPKVTWWKNCDISRLPFTLANFAWNFATFQKNRTPAWYFSADVSRVFMHSC